MNIIRTCLAGAAFAVVAAAVACSDTQLPAPPDDGARLEVTPTEPETGIIEEPSETTEPPLMGLCADSTWQLMPMGCVSRGGMLGSGT